LAPTVGSAATGFCYPGGILQAFIDKISKFFIDKIRKLFIDKISKFRGCQEQQSDRFNKIRHQHQLSSTSSRSSRLRRQESSSSSKSTDRRMSRENQSAGATRQVQLTPATDGDEVLAIWRKATRPSGCHRIRRKFKFQDIVKFYQLIRTLRGASCVLHRAMRDKKRTTRSAYIKIQGNHYQVINEKKKIERSEVFGRRRLATIKFAPEPAKITNSSTE
jgi:hypothetical protein